MDDMDDDSSDYTGEMPCPISGVSLSVDSNDVYGTEDEMILQHRILEDLDSLERRKGDGAKKQVRGAIA